MIVSLRTDAHVKLAATILPFSFVVVAAVATSVSAPGAASGAPPTIPTQASTPHSQRGPQRVASARDVLPPPPPVRPPGSSGPAVFHPPPTSSGPRPANQAAAEPTDYPSSRPASGHAPGPPAASGENVLEAAKIIARVGDQVILAGDLLGQVNQVIHLWLSTVSAEQRGQISDEMIDAQRWRLIRQLLPQLIDVKLVYLDFLRSVPKERVPQVQDDLYQKFDEKQLPLLVQRANVQTAADLDRLLRSFGSSLDQQRRTFAEQIVALEWKRQHASTTREVSHDDLLAYYTEHQSEFQYEARCRWEQLSTYFDRYPSREAARAALARMGNEVYGGAPLSAVARRSSQGPTAVDGGAYDWTTQGSLRSPVLDAAIFSLEVGKLSKILEDEDGWHIVRVTERQDAGVIPFVEAQAAIKEKIAEQRAEAALQEYVEKLRAKTPVWTVFDEEPFISP